MVTSIKVWISLICYLISAKTISVMGNNYNLHRCYSCMSAPYEEAFKGDGSLSRHFIEPRNFTNACDDPIDPKKVGVVMCRTICLTLTQDIIVFGSNTGKKLTMRGCSSLLTKKGFHNRTIALFDRYDMCRDVKTSDLFHFDGENSQIVTVCSCLGDRCNGSQRVSGQSLGAINSIYQTFLLITFVSYYFFL